MDPHAVLGLNVDASLDEAASAYRRLAKRWHPDRAGEESAPRMIELNVAYELLRSALHNHKAANGPVAAATATSGAPGSWLPEAMRRALGRELLTAL